MAKFYITTTLPYVNAEPHIGFAMEIIRADVLARTHTLNGDEVFFNTGTDEHGQKIYQKAVEIGVDPKMYCDDLASKFRSLTEILNIYSDVNFIRTTDEKHVKAAQEFWNRCLENGDIYKKTYKVKYCVGCELEKSDSELADGRCPLHPNKELEYIEEENYFFRFSKYQEKLLELYKSRSDFVIPDFRQNEIKLFVEGGLQDFSISRLKSKMPWGVDVPGDPDQVMYVWFDALVNYISTLGWPEETSRFDEFWPGVQVCGKDNLRQQSAMWQAMLMSAGLQNSKQILVGGFLNSGGQKMSKSLGNTIDPVEWVNRYGVDALRYYLLGEVSVFEDSDVTKESFETAYQAKLANGIGNLCARVAAMAEKENMVVEIGDVKMDAQVVEKIYGYRFDEAIEIIWNKIREADLRINQDELWKLTGEKKKDGLVYLVKTIRQIGVDLQPFMPDTAKKILGQFGVEKIVKGENLFQRLEK